MATATMSPTVEAIATGGSTENSFVDFKSLCLPDYVEAAQRLISRLPADGQTAVQLQSELIKAEAWNGQRRQDLARGVYQTALRAVRQHNGFEPTVLFNCAKPRKGKSGRRVSA